MTKNREYEQYKDYMAHPERDFQSPPLAAWTGEDAHRLGRMLADPDTDWDSMVSTIQGRPSMDQRQEGRAATRQRSIRLPRAMDEYVGAAVRREGLKNASEYVRLLISRDAAQHQHKKIAA